MTETEFIEQNKATWQELENAILFGQNLGAEKLHYLFKKVSGDLAYAQTYYARRSVRHYLNALVNSMYDTMKVKKKVGVWSALQHFYSVDLPNEIIRNKKPFLFSFILFLICMIIGAYSTIVDESFPTAILGADYIAITNANISQNDPMAIYKSMEGFDSFLAITVNNIRVAFFTFISGIFGGIGSAFFLVKNGIMVGVFQTFFHTKGLLLTSFLVIWIHGTIEISSIVIAGAAGFIIGGSVLFPGTFTRFQSLMIGAKRSLRIMLSTVPLFVIAGFLEGFVTRKTSMPDAIKIIIIGLSAALIVFLYIYKPFVYWRSGKYTPHTDDLISFQVENQNQADDNNSPLRLASSKYRNYFESILFKLMIPTFGVSILLTYFLIKETEDLNANIFASSLFQNNGFLLEFLLLLLGLMVYFFAFMHLLSSKSYFSIGDVITQIPRHFIAYFVAACFIVIPLYVLPPWLKLIFILVIPGSIGVLINENANAENRDVDAVVDAIKTSFKYWTTVLLINLGIVLTIYFISFALNGTIMFFFKEMIKWHVIYDSFYKDEMFINTNLIIFLFMFLAPYAYLIFKENIQSSLNNKFSLDLREKIIKIGEEKAKTFTS